MNPSERIARNPRLLFWGRALYETKMLNAVIVLFYLHRGLGLDHVFYMSIVWSLTALVAEIPSGYLADRIGRKRTLILGVLLLIASHVVTFFAVGLWPFMVVFVLMSASYACFSGTEEALLYESLAETKNEHDMNDRNGKQLSARSLSAIFLPAIGALIAHDLLEWQFQLLIVLNLVGTLAALVILNRLEEPTARQSVATREISIFRQSLRTIKNDPWLLKVTLNKLLVFIAAFLTWRISQPYLNAHGFGAEALGIFYVSFQILEFAGGWFAGKIEKRVGTASVLLATPLVMIGSLLVSIFTTNVWIIFAALALAISANAFREPVFAHAVNARIHSDSRATTLSNLNVLKGLLDIPVLFLAGYFAQTTLTFPLILAIALCGVSIVLLPIRQQELVATKESVAATP